MMTMVMMKPYIEDDHQHPYHDGKMPLRSYGTAIIEATVDGDVGVIFLAQLMTALGCCER